MKKGRFLFVPFCLVAALMLASTCYGQTISIFVGSSGAFSSFGVSGVEVDPITKANGPCVATDGGGGQTLAAGQPAYHLWTAATGNPAPGGPITGGGVDANRNIAFPNELGNIWIEWDSSANPQTICAYLSVDSVVGNRLLFGTYNGAGGNFGHATLGFFTAALAAADPAIPTAVSCLGGSSQGGAELLAPFLTDDAAGLPCAVYLALNGQQFTAAVSDIRPEDAEYASQRAAAPCSGGVCLAGGPKDGLGYGGAALGLPGTPVKSAFSGASAQVIGYYISGNDPETSVAVLGGGGYTVQDVGAYPVMVFVGLNRTANACATDFAAVQPTNVPSHTLALLYGGSANANYFSSLSRTTDLNNLTPTQPVAYGGAGLNGCPVTILEREPISGTFNTFEFQTVHNQGVALSQEDWVDPALDAPENACPPPGTCGNPLWLNYTGDGSVRARVIGTGQMIKVADGATVAPAPVGAVGAPVPNAIGYAFWTFAAFGAAKAQANLRYLTVDGTDPLLPAYAGGAFPACAAPPCRVPFTNLVNGGYRIWNIIRMITATNPALDTAAGAPTAADVTLAGKILATGQDESDPTVGNITDFVPFQDGNGHILNVFRAHYSIKNYYFYGGGAVAGTITNGAILNGTNPFAVGGNPAYADNGGDMAGAIFNDQNDMDYLNDFGATIQGYLQ